MKKESGMSGDDVDVKGKKWKIDCGELIIPFLFLVFSVGFIVQIIGLSLLSVGFAIFTLVVFLPIVILLILQFGVRRVRVEESGKPRKEDWLARFSPGKVLTLKKTDDPAVKQVRFIILFILCFGVIGYLFGFHAFTFCFTLLSLRALGVTKPVQLLSLTFGITLFMYLIFDRLLMFPLPRGALFY